MTCIGVSISLRIIICLKIKKTWAKILHQSITQNLSN